MGKRPVLAIVTKAGTFSFVDLGTARGWNVWQLENGDWAWSAWYAASLGPRSGIEATEAKAQEAATRALDSLASEARAAAQARRELRAR
jgi:hypothetical protein